MSIDEIDSIKLKRFGFEYCRSLRNEGYVFAGIDSLRENRLYLHKGAKIGTDNYQNFSAMLENIQSDLAERANQGYPFARVVWDSIRIENGQINGGYSILEGPLIVNDSIVLINPIKTKHSFIEKSIGFESGQPYSEQNFQAFQRRLERVSFFTSRQKPDISFQAGKAWAYFDLEESKTGSFKGVLGLLPNQSANQNALITGSIDLRLENLFRTGKLLDISWNRFGEESQKLDLLYEHPYLAQSDLTVGGALHILRQDSAFLTQGVELEGSFYLKDRITLGLSYERESSSVLLSDPDRIASLNLLDYDQDRYSITFEQRIQRPSAFRDYFGFDIKAGIGTRNVRKNGRLVESYYDSIPSNSSNGSFKAVSRWQRKVSRTSAIYHSLSSSHLTGQLSQNQYFRLGGLQTLRGFNEQFFFAQSYIINQLEWRYFFEEESFLFAFLDHGFVKNLNWQKPIGFGGGFSLSTTSGLFSFAMAIGKVEGQSFDLANTKVHFGYLSRF